MNIKFLSEISKRRELISQLIARDIATRYKGSRLGLAWTVINPIIMISVYTLIFSQVFRVRWNSTAGIENPLDFGINLFCGLLIFNVFSECITRGPSLITGNPNYVKKVLFPLHTLGAMLVGSASINAVISGLILIGLKVIKEGALNPNIIAIPLAWFPMLLTCLGITWMLATVGVYIKDISQVTSAGVSMLMFLSPVFYPVSALPENLKWLAGINPVAITIENTRGIIMDNSFPSLTKLIIYCVISTAWCEISYNVLAKRKNTFGDMV